MPRTCIPSYGLAQSPSPPRSRYEPTLPVNKSHTWSIKLTWNSPQPHHINDLNCYQAIPDNTTLAMAIVKFSPLRSYFCFATRLPWIYLHSRVAHPPLPSPPLPSPPLANKKKALTDELLRLIESDATLSSSASASLAARTCTEKRYKICHKIECKQTHCHQQSYSGVHLLDDVTRRLRIVGQQTKYCREL